MAADPVKELSAKVQEHPQYKTPQRIYDFETKPSREEPRRIAESFLKKIASALKIKPDLSELEFDKVNKSVLGSHVLFQQHYAGKPISGAWIKVDIDDEGRVFNVLNDLVPEPNLQQAEAREDALLAPGSRQLTAQEAENTALLDIGASRDSSEILDSELLYYPYNGIPVIAWKLVIRTAKPLAEWKMYIDAITGEILFKHNQLKTADGKGRVFDPNPVVALQNVYLKENSRISKTAYVEVALRGLDGSGWLDGPYVTTKKTSKRVKRKNLKFIFSRRQRAFKEVMAYYHIDRVQRYIQELGFDNVLSRPVQVNIAGVTDDNSFYSPGDKTISFGTGGVDDAEDAEIILHEYGHAIQDDQVPGFGVSEEAGAMGEGWGDYLAASFFEKFKADALKPTMASWDAVSYSGQDPPCLRRLDSNKKYPKDMTHEVHNDGEIWSASLWEIRAALGREVADKVIIAHHFLLSRMSTFEDAAKSLIQADKKLNGGRNKATINAIFVSRGIFPNPKRKNARAGEPFSDSPTGMKGK